MKICARGDFGEFEWTPPETIVQGINNAMSSLPIADQAETEKQLLSIIEMEIKNMLMLEVVVVAKLLLGNRSYADILNNHLLEAHKEMIGLNQLEEFLEN